ncbi:hypothetical protein GGR73_001066 [Xanthomonas sp. F14]
MNDPSNHSVVGGARCSVQRKRCWRDAHRSAAASPGRHLVSARSVGKGELARTSATLPARRKKRASAVATVGTIVAGVRHARWPVSRYVGQSALPLRMSCGAITGSLRHHVPSAIMVGMNSSQITARTITVTPASTASAGSEVVVQLSASPDPRWQACFHFVVQGRDGFFLQGRPVFDNASFHGILQAGQAEAFRQELPDLLVSASALARAQVNKDAAR